MKRFSRGCLSLNCFCYSPLIPFLLPITPWVIPTFIATSHTTCNASPPADGVLFPTVFSRFCFYFFAQILLFSPRFPMILPKINTIRLDDFFEFLGTLIPIEVCKSIFHHHTNSAYASLSIMIGIVY